MTDRVAGSSFFTLLVYAMCACLGCTMCACSQPGPAPSDKQPADKAEPSTRAESTQASEGNSVDTASTELVAEFVEAFNAGEVDSLSQRFGDRVDSRVFTRASQLTPVSIVEPDTAAAFIEGYIEKIGRENLEALYKTGWTHAVAGAKKHGVGLVIVHSEGLEAYLGRRLYVPALVFGVRSKEGADQIVFGTVFAELMEAMDTQDGSMDKVVGEGIGVHPEEFDAAQPGQ